MALLKIVRGDEATLLERPVSDGALLFATDTKKIFLDNGSSHIEMTNIQDLSDYITETELSSAIAAESSARSKQDQLLQESINGKLDSSDLLEGSNITITPDLDSGHVTIAASVPDVSDFITETEADAAYAAKSHVHSAANITSGTFDAARIPTLTDVKIQSLSATKLTGIIPQANLPSYVDDVVEYAALSSFPTTGESDKIYIAIDTNKTYRWSGTAYVEISSSLALGTTSSTAFRGDYGNTAYQHATAKGSAFASGLYKITTNAEGHVTAATAVTKSDITALGIPGSDTNTNTTYTLTKSGSTITLEGSDGSSTSVTDANTTYTLSSFGVTATAAELNYTDGVTSNIQTQLNGKAASSHTHGTASTTAAGFLRQLNGSTSSFLRGDGTWATPPNTTYSTFGGASTSTGGSTGLVPAPSAGAATRYLRSDGTWTTPPDTNTTYSAMRGATSSAAGAAGLVPAPAAGAATRYLRSDGTWAVPPDTNTTYTLSSFGITATAAELNKLDGVTATATEINYLDGVTSAIQTQLNGKAASSHSHPASQVTGLTASRALISDANGHPAVSAVTSTELGYLDGVTSAIQTQLNGKASTSHTHSYLPLSGGTLTGTVTSRSLAAATDSTYDIGTSSVRYRNIYADNLYGTLQGSVTSANQLTTARTISLTGDVTGSTSFNGSANVSISASLAANSVTATEIAAGAVGSSELASNAVSLAKLATDVGTVAVQSSTPTDTNVKLWIQI